MTKLIPIIVVFSVLAFAGLYLSSQKPDITQQQGDDMVAWKIADQKEFESYSGFTCEEAKNPEKRLAYIKTVNDQKYHCYGVLK